jgi:gelsolin
MELFGSELESKIKEASAGCEPAWRSVDMSKPSVSIWRVERFKLAPTKPENFGMFYEGDSYVILAISLDSSGSLRYNVHFWLGDQSSQDEVGTAAYKAVELDTFLHGRAVQHRETQNGETDLFRSYFPNGITYKLGGVETGFKKVTPYSYDNYKPILFKVHNSSVTQIPVDLSLVNQDDAFIFDMGLSVYVYIGNNATHKEGLLAQYHAQTIKSNRTNCFVFDLVAREDKHSYDSFTHLVSGYSNGAPGTKKLTHIKDTGDSIVLTELPGPITYKSFDTNDAFLFETLHTTFVWIGKTSDHRELLTAWSLAFKVTDNSSAITLVKEGYEPESFFAYL